MVSIIYKCNRATCITAYTCSLYAHAGRCCMSTWAPVCVYLVLVVNIRTFKELASMQAQHGSGAVSTHKCSLLLCCLWLLSCIPWGVPPCPEPAGLPGRSAEWPQQCGTPSPYPETYADQIKSFLIYEGNREACRLFYIQLSPKQGIILDLTVHTYTFSKLPVQRSNIKWVMSPSICCPIIKIHSSISLRSCVNPRARIVSLDPWSSTSITP